MEKIGRGLEIRNGIVLRAVRGLAHRAGITEEEALRQCIEFKRRHPEPPPISSPELIAAGDPGHPVLLHTKTKPTKTLVQWWEVSR